MIKVFLPSLLFSTLISVGDFSELWAVDLDQLKKQVVNSVSYPIVVPGFSDSRIPRYSDFQLEEFNCKNVGMEEYENQQSLTSQITCSPKQAPCLILLGSINSFIALHLSMEHMNSCTLVLCFSATVLE